MHVRVPHDAWASAHLMPPPNPFNFCPTGAVYIGAKGVGFLIASLMHAFPQIGELLASMQAMVGKAKA